MTQCVEGHQLAPGNVMDSTLTFKTWMWYDHAILGCNLLGLHRINGVTKFQIRFVTTEASSQKLLILYIHSICRNSFVYIPIVQKQPFYVQTTGYTA